MMAADEHHITVESQWQKHSVFQLPPHYSFNTHACKPTVISFGPYHYDEPHLKPMEAYKLRSLESFLKTNEYTSLKQVVQSFEPEKKDLMDHYPQLDNNKLKKYCFLELMIRDGCFMLDILQTTTRDDNDLSADYPIFGGRMNRDSIKRDMLLIENQLPLLVLEKLIADNKIVLQKLKDKNTMDECEITEKEFIHKKIHELILNFLEYDMHIQNHNDLCHHALDVCRENMIQIPSQIPSQRPVEKRVVQRDNVPSATALQRTGVTFKRNNTSSFVDITFKNEVLTLPHIFIEKQTESTFLNLMAFECFKAGEGREVSAYINFMESLVRYPKDVRFLRKMEIITTSRERERGSDKEIVALFHDLAKNQIVDPDDSLDEVRQLLSKHYTTNSTKCKEKLTWWGSNFKYIYCSTPWPAIGVFAGTTILVLTCIQTVYTVLSYYEN